MKNDPQLDWVIRKGPSGPRMVTSPDFRVLFLYPCREKTIINAMGIHMDTRDQTKVGELQYLFSSRFDTRLTRCKGFHVPSTRTELVEKFKDFGTQFQHFLDLTDEEVGLWQLRSMPNLPKWTNERACLLGDSAHAMLPSEFLYFLLLSSFMRSIHSHRSRCSDGL